MEPRPPPGQQLETYSYLGLATVIGRTLPEPAVSENIYLDNFGNVQLLQMDADAGRSRNRRLPIQLQLDEPGDRAGEPD